ncbi:MAG: class B sortase [Bacilli bacterium]
MKKKLRLKKKYNIMLATILLLLSISFLLLSSYKLYNWCKDNFKVKEVTKSIVDDTNINEIKDSSNTIIYNEPEKVDPKNDYWDYIKVPLMNVDFNELLKKNDETVGWIKVNGTSINYPFVKTTNNEYYLTHAIDGTRNNAGWLFMDYRNNTKEYDKNTIIYGHARVNNTMFGTLKKILNNSWQENKDNQVIKISTPYENTSWQVFSVYSIPVESYYLQTNFNNNEDYLDFLKTINERSFHKYDVSLNEMDKILTLSTCLNDVNSRVVLHAKLIKKEIR